MSDGIYELLAGNLPKNADKTALVDAKRSVTYAELSAACDIVADFLAREGIVPGDRVVVHLRKGIQEVVAMFGAAKIGAVVVNVNTQWTTDQLLHVLNDSGARALIADPGEIKRLSTRGIPDALAAILIDGISDLPDLRLHLWSEQSIQGEETKAKCSENELAMIIYTSGSTGLPKGVMLSHKNICVGAETVIEYLGLKSSDRLLSVLPYSFDAGLNQLTTMLMLGGTVVHQPVTMPTEIVRCIVENDVTAMAGVPPLWNQLVRLLDASPTKLSALRLITNTGGKIPPDVLERMPKVFPDVQIFLMYGLTEAFRSTYLPPEKFDKKMGSIGQAVPNAQVFVVQNGKGVAGPGEQGELVHAGPLVSLGYWNQPELSAEKIRPCPELQELIGDAPVVYSGDIVRVDEDGDLWFVGRTDDMIKTSGFRLSPTEVEDLVSTSGLVTDVVAYGVDDHDLGQVVHLVVSASHGFEKSDLRSFCRKTMPHYMIPREIYHYPNAMPRTASGKLDRPTVISLAKSNTDFSAQRQKHSSDQGNPFP